MTQGYLVMAQGDYLDMAIALAESIKRTQTVVNNISIIVDQAQPPHPAVDQFIVLEEDLAEAAEWKIQNRVFFYDLSPYDETVILDADMLFLDDVSHWWQHMTKFEMLCTDKVKTYRNEWVTTSPYRKTFMANNIPNVYSAFTYFKKTKTANDVFELVKLIITNWEDFIDRYAPENRQDFASIDLALGIAVKVLGLHDQVFSPCEYPTFTHMKSGCQGWKDYSEDWSTHLGVYTTGNNIRLGDSLQSGILHYVDKNFLKALK